MPDTHARSPRSVPTRISGDIAAIASSVAPREGRSFAEQVNDWARVGMQVERSGSLATRRLLAVAAGEEQFSALDDDERLAAHALIDAGIAAHAAAEQFGSAARRTGQRTVSLYDDGRLVEIDHDGTIRPL